MNGGQINKEIAGIFLEFGVCEAVEERWKPRGGAVYFYIVVDTWAEVYSIDWVNDSMDKRRFAVGNVFETKEQAEEALKRVEEVLKSYHE